ncbi:histone-lysine N-methyltransferase NSD2-like isoform X2 [Tubulanus polymorphus]
MSTNIDLNVVQTPGAIPEVITPPTPPDDNTQNQPPEDVPEKKLGRSRSDGQLRVNRSTENQRVSRSSSRGHLKVVAAADKGLLDLDPNDFTNKLKEVINILPEENCARKRKPSVTRIDSEITVKTPTMEEMKPSRPRRSLNTETIDKPVITTPVITSDNSSEVIVERPSNVVERPSKWLVGDLIWCKVTGHPWWPCMVSFDPNLAIYTQSFKQGKYRKCHVQFFGEKAERGWIHESSSLELKGSDPFSELENSLKQQSRPKFTIAPGRKVKWDLAYEEVLDALQMDRNQRNEELTFDYRSPEPSESPEAVNTKGGNSRRRKMKRKVKSQSDLRDVDVSKISMSLLLQKKLRTPFEFYCEINRTKVKLEHVEFTEIMVKEYLKHEWTELSELQKQQYTVANFSAKNSSRTRKPSAKLMEAMNSLKSSSPRGTSDPRGRRITASPQSIEAVINETVQKSLTSIYDFPDDDNFDGTENHFTPKPKPRQKRKLDESDAEQTTSTAPAKRRKRDAPSTGSGQKQSRSGDVKSKSSTGNLDDDQQSTNSDSLSDSVTARASRRIENICQICYKNGKLTQCTGVCLAWFHLDCLGITVQSVTQFRCDQCTSGVHLCFVCQKPDQQTKKCSISHCGKFYHEDCIKSIAESSSSSSSSSSSNTTTKTAAAAFICPLHTCDTCTKNSTENTKKHTSRGKLMRCVKCPTAYHQSAFCLSAGVEILSNQNIICNKHFQFVKGNRHHSHINISWCFECSKGGSLLCCESCPAAFHPECLNITFPEGQWNCNECSQGRVLLFGEIVWVKLGNYRWWPAEIQHPKNIPDNIQNRSHQVGEFPVRFFGSHDYFWTHKGRVFPFQEGDKGSRESASSKGLAKMFKLAVTEATEAFNEWTQNKNQKEKQEQEKHEKKPPHFKHIKTNIPYGNVAQLKADLSQVSRCECKPDQENPCGSHLDCLNRMLMYECHSSVCPAQDKCLNLRFQKRQYADLAVFRTKRSGWGLKCNVELKKRDFVIEYVGELIDDEECKKRIEHAHEENVSNFYMLTIDKNRVIDAGPKGNLSRFMNHSCQPNCETQKWMVNGDIRVGLFASQTIPAGSELTFNYNLECLGNDKTVCQCGTANCSGFIGIRPKTAKENKTSKTDLKKKKKKKKQNAFKHDDDCYRCGNGGKLILCSKHQCPRAYHLECLNADKPPYGKWYCPWHQCDVCGKNSSVLCQECPNSFCGKHSQFIHTNPDGKMLCEDHEEKRDEGCEEQSDEGREEQPDEDREEQLDEDRKEQPDEDREEQPDEDRKEQPVVNSDGIVTESKRSFLLETNDQSNCGSSPRQPDNETDNPIGDDIAMETDTLYPACWR